MEEHIKTEDNTFDLNVKINTKIYEDKNQKLLILP